MSNSYSSTLLTDELAVRGVAKIGSTPCPAGLAGMITLASIPNSDKPKSQMQFKIVTATGAAQLDATDFEVGNSTIDNLPAVPHMITQSWNVSNADLQGGLRPEDLAVKNYETFAAQFWQQFTPNFTAGNFASITVAPAAFGLADVSDLQTALKAYPVLNLVIRRDAFSSLANAALAALQPLGDGTYTGLGFRRISLCSNWAGSDANTYGIAWAPTAVVAGTGLPVKAGMGPDVRGTSNQASSALQIPGLEGFQIYLTGWFKLKTRSEWRSFDSWLATAPLDTAGAVLIKSP